MDIVTLDLMGVYAYSDSSHARERELWRGFLSYALAHSLDLSVTLLDKLLAEAVVVEFNKLTVRGGGSSGIHESLRCISAMVAHEIGVSSEFAVASFYEGAPPTKLHRLPRKRSSSAPRKADVILRKWLVDFSKIQNNSSFLQHAELWKTWFNQFKLAS